MSQLRIGTAGWSYPSGAGTWNGIFYPLKGRRTTRGGKFDELAYYAEHFDTVEVNSSFYRVPTPATTRSWVKRTPPGFEFSFKLFQKFTHPRMYAESSEQPQGPGGVVQTDVDEVRRSLDPVVEAGKLGAILAQFPPSFHREPATMDYLDWVLGAFRGLRVAVELRHRSWSDRQGETLDLLNSRGAALVQIDEPKFRLSIRQNFLPNVQTFYYMRLHGRNAAQWWKHEHADDRYNYLYSARELQPIVDTADAVRHLVRKLYLYFNNHFAAKAVANAAMVKDALGLPNPGTYPEAFVEAYPDLEGRVATSTSLLSRTSS